MLKAALILLGLILMAIGCYFEVKLLWFDYPDLTQRRLWMDHTGAMLFYSILAIIGYILIHIGLYLKR